MRLLILVGLMLPLWAADKEETKAVDAIIKAQRQVEHVQGQLDKAYVESNTASIKLTFLCKSRGLNSGVKPNGILGCVPQTQQATTQTNPEPGRRSPATPTAAKPPVTPPTTPSTTPPNTDPTNQ